MTTHKLSDILLNEVSFVDRGANPGAHLMFWKRDGGDMRDKAALVEMAKSMFGMEDGEAETFSEAINERSVQDAMWRAIDALRESVQSIYCDESLDGAAREPLLNQSLGEFKTYLQDLVPDAVAKALSRQDNQTGATMSDAAIAKALGLPETATATDIAAAVAKQAADLVAAQAEVTKAATALAISKLSPDEVSYCDAKGFDDVAKGEFAGKKPEDRAAEMKDKPVAKSAAEVALEKSNSELAELRKRLDAQEASGAIAAITKRAETDLVAIGKADEVASLLHSVAKGAGQDVADKVEALLKDASTKIEKSGAFDEVGSGRAGVSKALDAITAKAQELQKSNPTWSIQKARTEARRQNPDLAKQERDETRAAA